MIVSLVEYQNQFGKLDKFSDTEQDIIISKLKALLILNEASGVICRGGNYLLRVVSRYATCGRYYSKMNTVKRHASLYSKDALALIGSPNAKFEAEHPFPIAAQWSFISNNTGFGYDQLYQKLARLPIIVVTDTEHKELSQIDRDTPSFLEPWERYEKAGIEIVQRLAEDSA
jgi:hypothetical protein